MKKDHRLGFPPVAAEAALVADYPEHRDWDRSYPLGLPARVIEKNNEATQKFCDAVTTSPEVFAFESGDHKENGTIAEGVSDSEMLRGIDRNMGQLKTQEHLAQFVATLTERLKPLRSRGALDMVGTLYRGHAQRLSREKQETNKVDAMRAEVSRQAADNYLNKSQQECARMFGLGLGQMVDGAALGQGGLAAMIAGAVLGTSEAHYLTDEEAQTRFPFVTRKL